MNRRTADTYRGARRNAKRSNKAQKLKAMRLMMGCSRSALDFTRHLHPASYRVIELASGGAVGKT